MVRSPMLSPTRAITRNVLIIYLFARRLRPRLFHDQTSSSVRKIPTGILARSTLRSPALSPKISPSLSPVIGPPPSSPKISPFLIAALLMKCCHPGFRNSCDSWELDIAVLLFSSTVWRRKLLSPTTSPALSRSTRRDQALLLVFPLLSFGCCV